MSIEEIIKDLDAMTEGCEEASKDPVCADMVDGLRQNAKTLREAIALLRTYPDAQPNEPLTLEELREMQAKPGWLDCKYEKGWGIISVSEFGRMISITTLNDTYFIYANGEYNDLLGAKIYLCPPKEEER